MACVNKSYPGYSELAQKFGDSLAESIVIRNNYAIPSIEEALNIVRSSKVLQFKSSLNYIGNTVSNNINDLTANFDKIVQTVNGKPYIVRGAKFAEKEASLAEIEIKGKNMTFLDQVNNVVRKKLFKLPSNTEMVIRQNKTLWNNMTEDFDGNFVFFHYSNQDLSKKGIDPAKFGSNTQLTGSEERQRSVPANFYYVNDDTAEQGVGNFKHVVRVTKDKVYPFNADPLNLLPEAKRRFTEKYPNRAFTPNDQVGWVGTVAAESGYEMVVAEWGNKNARAESVKKQTPQLVSAPPTDGFYGSNVTKSLTDEVFITNKQRYPAKDFNPTDLTRKLIALNRENYEKNFPGVDEFSKFILPTNIYNKHKALYKLAESLNLQVNVPTFSIPGAVAYFGHGSINIPATIVSNVNNWEEFTETLNHEIIHGLVYAGFGNKYELHSGLKPVWDAVLANRDKASPDIQYIIDYIEETSNDVTPVSDYYNPIEGRDGINPATGELYKDSEQYPTTPDLEEIITYTFTNPKFLNYLDSIQMDVEKGVAPKSVFNQLLDTLRSLIKKVLGNTTAADQVLESVNNHFAKIKSQVDYIAESKKDPYGAKYRGLANPIMKGEITKEDLFGKDAKNITNAQVAEALHQYYKKNFKVLRSNEWGEKSLDLLSDYAADEITLAVEMYGANSGKGWYTEDYKAAMDELGKVIPELKDDVEMQQVATLYIAVASNSSDPEENIRNIFKVIEGYKATGRIPEDLGTGTGASAIASGLGKINKLIDLFDGDINGVSNFLQTEMTVGQSAALAKGAGIAATSDWGKDLVFPVSISVLGPKIGAFYANLSGMGGLPTIDRWAARTIARYRGDARDKIDPKQYQKFVEENNLQGKKQEEVIALAKTHSQEYAKILGNRGEYGKMSKEDKNKEFGKVRRGHGLYNSATNIISDIPGDTAAEQRRFREFSYKVMLEAQRKVKERTGEDLSVSDVQAILWLYEKRLFETLGVAQKASATYSEAAKKIVSKIKGQEFVDAMRGMTEQEFTQLKTLGLEDFFTPYTSEFGQTNYDRMYADISGFYPEFLELNDAQQAFVAMVAERNATHRLRGMIKPPVSAVNEVEKETKTEFIDAINKKANDKFGKSMLPSVDNPNTEVLVKSQVGFLENKNCKANRCETNAFEVVKENPDRYYPVGGYFINKNNFPVEHWWVYDKQTNKHMEVTPDDSPDVPADYVKGYVGYVNKDINDEIKDADRIWDIDFFKGGNIQSQYFNKFIAEETKAPTGGRKLFSEPNPETKVISEQYKKDNGITTGPGAAIHGLDVENSKAIADAYSAMKDTPNDPTVKAAYDAMADETVNQFNAIKEAGYEVEIYEGTGEPYANSQEMIADVKNNKHMFILSTEKDFGQTPITDQQRQESALLRDSGVTDKNGKPLLVNDVFRFVHDFFGHTERGNSFGPIGEENAWDVHARMYTPLARRAMTTETRGQNSWVNFGPHMRNSDGSIKKPTDPGFLTAKERPFAEQKIGLLPTQYSNLAYEPVVTEVEEPTIPESLNVPVEIDATVLNTVVEENKTKVSGTNKPFDSAEPKEKLQKVGDDPYLDHQQKGAFALNNVIAMIKFKFGIPVETVNEPGKYWRGKYVNGKVILNEAYVNASTPFHEILHPIVLVMKNENPELYNELVAELESSEAGKAEIARVEREYPELSPADQKEEALVSFIGKLVTDKYQDKQSLLDKVLDWLKGVMAKLGINAKEFSPKMNMGEVADLILDPSFVMDLERGKSFEELAEYNQKATPIEEERFNTVMDDILKKLRADTNVPAKNDREKTRKFFSAQQVQAFEANRQDLQALDSFILSALSNTKKITEGFEKFKTEYEAKKTKTPADIKKMADMLYEIENNVVLYSDARPLVRSMAEIFPDEENAYGSLFNYLNRQDDLINGYKNYGTDLIAEWLMPYMTKAVNEAKSKGGLNKIIPPDVFIKVKNRLAAQGITDENLIINAAIKEEIKNTISVAKEEADFLSTWLSGILNSRDSISQLVGLALSDEMNKSFKKAIEIKEKISAAMKQYRGSVKFSTPAAEEEFYKKFLRQAESHEYVGLDANGNEKYEDVKRWAFHEEYLWDQFYKSKREFFAKLGDRPPKAAVKAFKEWEAKKKAWYDQNTVPTQSGTGITYTPAAQYKNAQFQGMMADPYYNILYTNYKNSNDIAGNAGLKYGIVPQVSKGRNLFTGVTKKQGVKEKLKGLGSNLAAGVGSEEQIYYAENIEGFERKTIPINHIKLLDEEDLSFNLADSVFKYAASTSKYEAMKGVEPHVMVLKNFLNGNSYLKVDKRKALQNSAKGVKKLIRGTKTLIPGDATKLNSMLNGFVNDVMYGESDERKVVQLWGSRFTVHLKGDTSNNGQPMKQAVKNFEDLKSLVNKPDLNYSDFKVGEPVELNGYVITLTNDDVNLSLNKIGNFGGIVTALQNMALNVNSLVMNVGIGNISSFVEASGGKHFGLKDWAFAQKEYWKSTLSGDMLEDVRGGKQSKLSQLMIHYNAMQGEFEDSLGKEITPGVANKLLRRDHLFVVQHVGEHQIQGVGMIAQLKAQKVQTKTGETISLYDAWEMDQDNNIKLRADVEWSDIQDTGFSNALQGVNKELNGNFSKLDKAKLQRIWWGRALLMFRKHIYNAFKARYGKEQVSYERGIVTEGYYRTFWKMTLDQLSEYILNKKFKKLSEQEVYAMRKLGADLAVVAALFALYKGTDDDDKENEFTDNVAFWSRRLLGDTSQYAPVVGWLELWKIVKDPSASVNTIEKYYGALSQVIAAPEETYTRNGPGYTKGELKWKVKMAKVIPLYRQFVNLQDPENMLNYYQMNVKSIYNKSKTDEKAKEEENK